MADPAETGKYGTVKLLKRKEPSTVVASYPVDEEEVTFGRDSSCGVRLYYQWVSSVHCKLVFEERKAFLQIFGANGVVVDGCPVFPAKGSETAPTTVPLPNGSTFEIHKKLFMFNYPPKELRPQLFTPVAESKRHKNLRMSMVQSAQVFSPAPSPNPRDNLRTLQSPLKLSSLPEEEPITLVDGNNPLVFQEEQDLVILEDFDPSDKATLPPLPVLPQLPPQTPRRKSIPSLHRAVLIRSAQRVQHMRELQAHRQRTVPPPPQVQKEVGHVDDDAAEEDEVEEAISDDLITFEESEESDDEDAMDEDAEGENDNENDDKAQTAVDNMEDEQDITEARGEYEEMDEPRQTAPVQAGPVRPPLGKFMTPQPSRFFGSVKEEAGKQDTISRGPQRPPPGYRFSLGPGLGNGTQNLRQIEEASTETDNAQAPSRSTSPSKSRPEVSEEERKAIIERRKSALKAPDTDFAGHAPGLQAGRTSLAPKLPATPASPFKNIRATIDDGEDTRSVLQRLEESLEDMRNKTQSRQSIGLGRGSGFPASPEKSGFSLLANTKGLPSTFDKTKIVKRDLRMPSYGRDMSTLVKGTASQLMKDESDERESDMDVDDAGHNRTKAPEEKAVLADMPDSPSKEAKAARRARRSEIVSATPRMDGVKEMFHAPRAGAGLATPAVRGMRDLFREQPTTHVPSTPRLDGMRPLFSQRRVPPTPAYDGINEIMPEKIVEEDEEDNEQAGGLIDEVALGAQEDKEMHDDPEPEPQPSAVPRTVARSKGKVVRGTPTDLSTMADDEMTPDAVADAASKKRVGKTSADEGAVVHKTSRARKPASKRSVEAIEDANVATKAKKPASRKGVSSEGSSIPEAEPAQQKSKPRSRSQKAEPSGTGTEAGTGAPPKPARRARTASATTNATSEDERPAARVTRARSRSVEPDGESSTADSSMRDDPLANAAARYKRGTRTKVQAVETIPEEQEAPPAKSAPKTTASRSRKAQAQSDIDATGADDASAEAPARKKPASRSRTTKELAPVDAENARKEIQADKENTPERSPASSNDSNEESVPAKTNGRSRTTPKTAASKLPTSKTSRSKKPATTDEDSSTAAVAPRATRTRARK